MCKYFVVLLGLLLVSLQTCSSGNEKTKSVKKSIKTKKSPPRKKIKEKRGVKSKIITLKNAELFKARESKKQPAYRFGKVNNIQVDNMLKKNQRINIRGKYLNFKNAWAYDNLSKKAGSGAMIRIDNKYYEIKYGVPRPDVSKYLKLKETINCGITGKVDISNLKTGQHSMTICLRGTNKLYYLESEPIKFYNE